MSEAQELIDKYSVILDDLLLPVVKQALKAETAKECLTLGKVLIELGAAILEETGNKVEPGWGPKAAAKACYSTADKMAAKGKSHGV